MRMILLLTVVLIASCASAEGEPRGATTGGPLVLELFTSQGCSSCPPADALLSRLARSGDHVAPLSFHVDYWNDLGWADPFSLPAWTARQQGYARALGDNRVYTPELVIGGATGVVGSQQGAVSRAIADAARPAVLAATATWSHDKVEVKATAPADADVFVAVWEETTRTRVPRGENAGATLDSDRVVRRFERVAAAGHDGAITVTIDPGWRAGAVAFAQRADKKIVASALLPH
jgi:hypothetical protein